MTAQELLFRVGGVCLILFIPLLVIGSILYARIGMSSGSEGADALRRIASAGTSFPIMNALFHLGALLLLPGAAALAIALRGADRDGWIVLGTALVVLAVTVGAGFVFALNHGLYGIAGPYSAATPEQQGAYAVAASMNLRTQAGAELVQSMGLGLWVLCLTVGIAAAGWPAWLTYLGIAGGVGFIAAGLSSVLMGVPGVGPALGALGGLGLLLFATWLVAIGIQLVTLAPPG